MAEQITMALRMTDRNGVHAVCIVPIEADWIPFDLADIGKTGNFRPIAFDGLQLSTDAYSYDFDRSTGLEGLITIGRD